MFKKIILFIFIGVQAKPAIIVPQKKDHRSITCSVIIPCYYGHFMHLENLLMEYTKQTVYPDEIVISLSEAHKINQKKIKNLENKGFPFKVNILKTKHQLFAGENRNIAAANSLGDIIICQDADDIPHPQRIEIIKHIFENYNVEFLMHYMTRDFKILNHNFLYQDVFLENSYLKEPCNGNVALKRELFYIHEWPNFKRGQDMMFNANLQEDGYILYKCQLPLILYRQNFSAEKYVKSLKKKPPKKSGGKFY